MVICPGGMSILNLVVKQEWMDVAFLHKAVKSVVLTSFPLGHLY
jgi:hypothetical protein